MKISIVWLCAIVLACCFQSKQLTLPDLPDIVGGVLNIDMSDQELTDIQLDDLMDAFDDKYKDQIEDLLELNFNLSRNKVTSISPLAILQKYNKISTLSLSLQTMDPQLTAVGSLDFLKSLPLTRLTLLLDRNLIDQLDFLRPVFDLPQLCNLALSLNNNKITSVAQFSRLIDLQNLLIFNLSIVGNEVSDLSTLYNLYRLKNLSQILIYVNNFEQVPKTGFYFANFLPAIQLFEMNTKSCQLGNRQYMDAYNLGLTCGACREDCEKCFGPEIYQCLACKTSPESASLPGLSDNACRIYFPKIESDKYLAISLQNQNIDDKGFDQVFRALKYIYEDPSQVKGFELDISQNKINNFLPFATIMEFTYITKLFIRLNQNNPPLSTLFDLSALKQMQLTELRLYLEYNDLSDITKLKPIFEITSIVNLEINLSNNKIENLGVFSDLPNLAKLSQFIFSIAENQVQDYSPIYAISEVKSLKSFDLSFKNSGQLDNLRYNFLEKMDDSKNLNIVAINQKQCFIIDGFYIAVTNEGKSWECNQCEPQCTRCFGKGLNYCYSCIDGMIFDEFYHQCRFYYPEIDVPDKELDITMNNLKIQTYQLEDIVDTILTYYTPQKKDVKYFTLNLEYNEIQNFGPLSELDDLSYMENITFKLKTQSSNPNLQYKYGFLRALNHLTNLLYVTVDDQSCLINSTYMEVYDEDDHWRCQPCSVHCTHCFGSESNECVACENGYSLNDDTQKCIKNVPKKKKLTGLEISLIVIGCILLVAASGYAYIKFRQKHASTSTPSKNELYDYIVVTQLSNQQGATTAKEDL